MKIKAKKTKIEFYEQPFTDGRRLSLIELLKELTKSRAETPVNLVSYTGVRSDHDQPLPQRVKRRGQYVAVCDALFADMRAAQTTPSS